MPNDLRHRLRQLHSERERFWNILESVSAESRDTLPSPNAWSPQQIAEHIFRTENTTLGFVEKQLDPDGEWRDIGSASKIRFAGLIAALKSPKKFKVPEKAPVFPDGIPYDDMMADWKSMPDRWDSIIQSFPPERLNEAIIRHPVVGPITIGQTLQFLAAHSARHLKQLQRTASILPS